MKILFSISLAFTMLVANSNLALSMHFCNDVLANLAFFKKADNCCANECKLSAVPKSCPSCDDVEITIEEQTDDFTVNHYNLTSAFVPVKSPSFSIPSFSDVVFNFNFEVPNINSPPLKLYIKYCSLKIPA